MTSFKFKKAVQALNYFARKEGGSINYMKAVKLVWLSDRKHLRTFGRSITSDKYVAMKNGPVPSGTKDIILKSGFSEKEVIQYSNLYLSQPQDYRIASLNATDLLEFSKTDLSIMDDIYMRYGALNEFELSDFSHLFPEWKRYEEDLKSGVAKAFKIQEEDFFLPESKIEPFTEPEELLALSREFYEEAC